MTIGMLIEDHVDDREFIYPYYRLQEAGFSPLVIGPDSKDYRSKAGISFKAEIAAENVKADELAGLIIPGGYAPDRMRRHQAMVEVVQAVDKANLPLGSICHAGWMIISAKVVRGRRLTGHMSTRDDLTNAGAIYLEDRVVVDGNLVTAQHYLDLPGFMKAFLEVLTGARADK
jgi:protease I